jgi:hypothetical protein
MAYPVWNVQRARCAMEILISSIVALECKVCRRKSNVKKLQWVPGLLICAFCLEGQNTDFVEIENNCGNCRQPFPSNPAVIMDLLQRPVAKIVVPNMGDNEL